MLLHFVLVLHFAAIVITFCVSITFCGDYYVLRRNRYLAKLGRLLKPLFFVVKSSLRSLAKLQAVFKTTLLFPLSTLSCNELANS